MNFEIFVSLLLLCYSVRLESFNGNTCSNKDSGANRAFLKGCKCACSCDEIRDNFPANRCVQAERLVAAMDIDDGYADVDLHSELLEENASNQLLERVVKQMTFANVPERGTLSPSEKFDEIYAALKASNNEEKEDLGISIFPSKFVTQSSRCCLHW